MVFWYTLHRFTRREGTRMEYAEPLKHLFWHMVRELDISRAQASAIIEEHGGAHNPPPVRCSRTCAVLARACTLAKLAELGVKGNTAHVLAMLDRGRRDLYVFAKIADNWEFLAGAGIARREVAKVTYAEWCAFDANPFVLWEHDVAYEVLAKRRASADARRYGAALEIVKRLGTASFETMRASMLERGVPLLVDGEVEAAGTWDRDLALAKRIAGFDPSGGRIADHRAAPPPRQEEGDDDDWAGDETFTDATTRVKAETGNELGFGEFWEYTRMRNNVEFCAETRAYTRRGRRGAAKRCAAFIAEAVWGGDAHEEGGRDERHRELLAYSRGLKF